MTYSYFNRVYLTFGLSTRLQKTEYIHFSLVYLKFQIAQRARKNEKQHSLTSFILKIKMNLSHNQQKYNLHPKRNDLKDLTVFCLNYL